MRTNVATKLLPLAGLAFFCVAGCAAKHPTTHPLTAAERSDKAKQDPFGYSPDFSDTDSDSERTTHVDRKGLKRDLENVLMP
jgi:hypothetical protein